MKTLNILISSAALLAFTACTDAAKTEETHAEAKDTAVAAVAEEVKHEEPHLDSAASAKAWEAYMTPGDIHKRMASESGKWKCEMTSWPAPGAPPVTSEATAEMKMILGGRYQESTYKGKMMGMDFEGHSIMAYDNSKKVFVSSWVDNMGTGIMTTEGPWDEGTKSINMTGTMTNPETGKDMEIRQVFKMPDEKTQIMELYCKFGGQEFKNMEVKMTKK